MKSERGFRFNQHPELKGKHAFLSPSKPAWLNYDREKLIRTFENELAKARGTKLHALADDLIKNRIALPRTKDTLNLYVNDAIKFNMSTEVPLFYSNNCFGTSDAVFFSPRDMFLRVHDLKTGETPAHMEQLAIYAALFCLEYGINPKDIEAELRLYQSGQVLVDHPEPKAVEEICDIIVEHTASLSEHKTESEV